MTKKLINSNLPMEMNLQFFAEPSGADSTLNEGGNEPSGADGGNEPNTPTVEELMAQLAQERAANSKAKAALDKALKETGDLKKSLRAKQSADEIQAEADAEAKAEHDAYVKDLETYKAKNEATKRYLMQGMSTELAEQAATAELDGDMDALSDIQKSFTDQLIKQKQAEWMKNRPQVNAGMGTATMTKDEIMAIADPIEQQKAIAQNIHLFQ